MSAVTDRPCSETGFGALVRDIFGDEVAKPTGSSMAFPAAERWQSG
jgi:hypothetical protein